MTDKVDDNIPQMESEEDPVEVAYQQWKNCTLSDEEREKIYISMLKEQFGNEWEKYYIK